MWPSNNKNNNMGNNPPQNGNPPNQDKSNESEVPLGNFRVAQRSGSNQQRPGQLNTTQPNDTDEHLNSQQMEEFNENNDQGSLFQFGPEDYGLFRPDLPHNHQFQLSQFPNAHYQHNQQQPGPFPYSFQHSQYQHEQLGAFNNLSSAQRHYGANDSHGPQHPSTPLSARQPSITPTTPQSAQGNMDKGDKKEEKNALLLKMLEQLNNKNNSKDNVNSTTSANDVSEAAARESVAKEAATRESTSTNFSQHKAPKSPAQGSPIKASANDIDDLISDGKISNMGLGSNANHNNGINTSPKAPSTISMTSRGGSQVRNSTSSGKNIKNGSSTKIASRPTSTGSISEGEILEDSTPKKVSPPTEPKYPTRPNRIFETGSRKDSGATEDQTVMNLNVARHRPRDTPSSPRAPSQHPKEHSARHGRDEQELKKVHDDRAVYSSSDHRSSMRQTDPHEDHHRADTKHDQKQEKKPAQKSSTLDQLIKEDADLRDWLQMTGWDNVTYREEKLNHRREVRRQIAELDAKKAELLALEAASGPSGVGLVSGSTMPPPVLPTQSSSRALVEKSGNTSAEPVRVISKKRSILEDDISDRTSAKRVKEEYDTDRHPGSSSSDAYRRSGSIRDHHERRHRERSYSHERDSGSSAYHNRPAARPTMSGYYDQDRERDDRPRDPRPFEVRGSYRGRAFDPHYRNRGGRGSRGRGESFHAQQDLRNEPGFGLRITNSKPFKDPKGFDKGGKGDTRYFIVKSFNEDNVLNCIEDSIWTTQVQNGQTFKEAFQTCKNVILVFSINKSKAFQGYARMESLPGSVPAPSWQNAINWESAGAFRVKWLTICSTQFNNVGHLKNKYNENLAVLIGKDGQEIEENCGAALIELIDLEAEEAIAGNSRFSWDDYNR